MSRFMARDDLLSLGQAARYTGLPARTIRYLADTGRLPFEVLAGSTRPRKWFRRAAVDRLLIPGTPGLPGTPPDHRRTYSVTPCRMTTGTTAGEQEVSRGLRRRRGREVLVVDDAVNMYWLTGAPHGSGWNGRRGR